MEPAWHSGHGTFAVYINRPRGSGDEAAGSAGKEIRA